MNSAVAPQWDTVEHWKVEVRYGRRVTGPVTGPLQGRLTERKAPSPGPTAKRTSTCLSRSLPAEDGIRQGTLDRQTIDCSTRERHVSETQYYYHQGGLCLAQALTSWLQCLLSSARAERLP